VEADSRNPFRNAGDCTSHTGLGGTLAAGDGQVTLTSTPGYPCAVGVCWGELSMSAIPAGDFALIRQSDNASWSMVISPDADGSYNGNANIPCNLPTTRFSTFSATVPTVGTSDPPAVPPDCGPSSLNLNRQSAPSVLGESPPQRGWRGGP
jgi:hypothetical protein